MSMAQDPNNNQVAGHQKSRLNYKLLTSKAQKALAIQANNEQHAMANNNNSSPIDEYNNGKK